ncbi:MAG: gfo/Idh/MocA family oxidoreductase, partial [bacterium]
DKGEKIDFGKGKVTPGGNWGSFIAACRAGKPEMANGNVKDAHYGCVLGHLMNNSYRLGEEVPFNQEAGRFGDNKDAAEHFGKLHEIMGKGVGVPEKDNYYTVGPWLNFDPNKERHTGEYAVDANKLLKNPNNSGFKVPGLKNV